MTNRLQQPISRPLVFLIGLVFTWTPIAWIPWTAQAQEQYFPETDERWETATPKAAGLKPENIKAAMDLSFEKNNSTSVVLLYRGRIVAERHLMGDDPKLKQLRLGRMRIGEDRAGRSLEDVASVQKSVTSVLLGIAIQKKLLKLDDPVSKHLGKKWSQADPEQESAIRVFHLATMTSGLNKNLEFVAAPGTRWSYNTSAYAKLMELIESASGLDRDELTRSWLTEPLGMKNTRWMERPRLISKTAGNRYGLVSTARDLARLGILIENRGQWQNKTIYRYDDYFRKMSQPSQNLNPSYGYLWWLNGQKTGRRQGPLSQGFSIPAAPDDLFAAAGALGRRLYIVPSKHLIVVRLGAQPKPRYPNEFWKALFN